MYKFFDKQLKQNTMERVFVVFNMSKGLWGKHLTQDKALKISKAVNGNHVIVHVIHGLHPKRITIDDIGSLSFEAESYPEIEVYEGELYEGELYV